MEIPELISLTTFATVAAFTPGPNNLLLAASSANFGWRKTLPHMVGVIAGFTLLVTIAALGLGWLLTALPGLQLTLRILGLAFILFIAYSRAASHSLDRKTLTRPMRFIEAVLFQWINPKGVVVIISAISAYTDTSTVILSEVLILVALFFWVTLGSVLLWAFSGALIASKLDTERKLMIFNRSAALLLLISVAPVLLDLL